MIPALLYFFKRASIHTFHLLVSWFSNCFSKSSHFLIKQRSFFLDIIQFLCYDVGIFYIVCRNILPHCRNLYEIEGERLCCQFVTQISVIKLLLPQHWSLQLCLLPHHANLGIFHIYIRNIRFLSTGSLFRLQNCPKSQAACSQSVRFLAF